MDPSSMDPSSMAQATSALPLAWFGLFAEAVPAPAVCSSGAASSSLGPTGHPPWECEVDASAHALAIVVIRGTIADGHAYLVNYTTRFRRPWSSDESAFQLYRRLLVSYTSGYHAFFETDEWAVACGSPELFFEQCGTSLVTRPMKGTTPRGRWAEEDIRRAEELRASAKERAENVMVVDLLRNDLGRIAVPGSVAVPSLWQLEQHPALWQLTSTVTATAREGVGLAEIFGALFPCASVTGAPKVSAMSVIADIEASPRGVYCGAVGFLAPPGDHCRSGSGVDRSVCRCHPDGGGGQGLGVGGVRLRRWDHLGLVRRARVGGSALESPGARRPSRTLIERRRGFDRDDGLRTGHGGRRSAPPRRPRGPADCLGAVLRPGCPAWGGRPGR